MSELKISKNPIENIEETAKILSKLPLKVLEIDISTEEDVLTILQFLPKLKFLNGSSVKEDRVESETTFALEDAHFQSISLQVTKRFREINGKLSKDFLEEYKEAIQMEHDKITTSFDKEDNDIYTRTVVSAKSNIYCFLLENIFLLLKYQDKELSELGVECLKGLHKSLGSITDRNSNKYETLSKNLQTKEQQLEQANDKLAMLEVKFAQLENESKKFKAETMTLNEKLSENKSLIKSNIKEIKKEVRMLRQVSPVKEEKKIEVEAKEEIEIDNCLPLKTLKEFVREIYQSKRNTDARNERIKMPRETMEQHLYVFVSHKYGLNVET